ncbi:MAG TPA: SHOCT domain-containing protein [Solirubrobacterales bacterium]|nr:SHOCT domain-containing protein [Solirubrobacterales bacterium]
MSYWDGDGWTSIPARLASRKEQEDFEWPDPPPPVGAKTLESVSEIHLDELTLLGGFGYPLVQNSLCRLEFHEREVLVTGQGASSTETLSILYSELTSLSISGAGKIREGGGFVGGGFGLEGFAIGASVAGLLNAMTTKHRVETLVGLQTDRGEMVFLCTTVEPPSLELELSRVRSLLRKQPDNPHKQEAGVAEELSRLADLVERGFLDREEFNRAKDRLLG